MDAQAAGEGQSPVQAELACLQNRQVETAEAITALELRLEPVLVGPSRDAQDNAKEGISTDCSVGCSVVVRLREHVAECHSLTARLRDITDRLQV